jgi:hypothetical protein
MCRWRLWRLARIAIIWLLFQLVQMSALVIRQRRLARGPGLRHADRETRPWILICTLEVGSAGGC